MELPFSKLEDANDWLSRQYRKTNNHSVLPGKSLAIEVFTNPINLKYQETGLTWSITLDETPLMLKVTSLNLRLALINILYLIENNLPLPNPLPRPFELELSKSQRLTTHLDLL